MKHVLPFPDFDLADRTALFEKLMAGVLVQDAPTRPWTGDPGDPASPTHWSLFPCWFFAGKWEDGKGYKKVKFKGQPYYVHRAMYHLAVEPVSPEHFIDHLCKNPGCCQPRHLEAVPPIVNTLRGDNPNWLLRAAMQHPDPVVAREGVREIARQMVPNDILASIPFKDAEERVLAHETTRWDTPDLLQAHIENGHPRFRAPLVAADPCPPAQLQIGEDTLNVEITPETYGARQRFVDEMMAGEGCACQPERIKYEFGVEAPASAPVEAIPNDLSPPDTLPSRLRQFLRMLWSRPRYKPARPARDMGDW